MFYMHNIKLQEAMTKELTHETRVWSVFGLHVEVKDISENFTVAKTVVIKGNGKTVAVSIEGTAIEEKGTFYQMKDVFSFSSLEELQKKCPQLFELEGLLIAFT